MENNAVLLSESEIIKSLITRYREEIADAASSTEEALKKISTQLTSLERNKIALAAQKALLDTLEKDLGNSIKTLTSTESNG